MICKCSECGKIYKVSGASTLLVLSGGMDCLSCGGNVNLISGKKVKTK